MIRGNIKILSEYYVRVFIIMTFLPIVSSNNDGGTRSVANDTTYEDDIKADEMTNREETGRQLSSNQLDTMLSDIMGIIAVPVAILISGYALYYILRSLLGPLGLFTGLEMILPLHVVNKVNQTGRRRKRNDHRKNEKLLLIFDAIEQMIEVAEKRFES
ncbi:Uncharacterised protein g10351 [Pycnogonum litorale]